MRSRSHGRNPEFFRVPARHPIRKSRNPESLHFAREDVRLPENHRKEHCTQMCFFEGFEVPKHPGNRQGTPKEPPDRDQRCSAHPTVEINGWKPRVGPGIQHWQHHAHEASPSLFLHRRLLPKTPESRQRHGNRRVFHFPVCEEGFELKGQLLLYSIALFSCGTEMRFIFYEKMQKAGKQISLQDNQEQFNRS